MPHFFFDWRDNGTFEEDADGMDLHDLETVKVEAARALIERARDEVPGLDRHSLSIEVRDESGGPPLLNVVLILEVHTIAATNR